MSIANLAARLDDLDAAGAFVTEGEASVTVSNLTTAVAAEILELCAAIGWQARAYDGAGTEWRIHALDDAYAPFRIELEKPAAPEGVLRLLTNRGFAAWLDRDEPRSHWQIGRITRDIVALSVSFTTWDGQAPEPVDETPQRSPRLLVREFSGRRAVPDMLDRWLLRDTKEFALDEPAVLVWAHAAARMLMLSLPDEVEAEQRILRFKGPPRLDLTYPGANDAAATALEEDGFLTLQAAAAWVFEIERESEMRHILLATELARCGGTGEAAPQFLRENLGAALEGARTAYQVQLAGMSSDALKTLTELRKSVTDETAKVADATRQIITAVAGALAVGAGLIAARLTTTTSPLLILLVTVVAGAYVAITILSGVMFTLLQRKVRKEWQPRLYRFLSKPDYDALVGGPARTAERTLWWSAGLGAAAIVVMAIVIFQVRPNPSSPNNLTVSNTASETLTAANLAEPTSVSQNGQAPPFENGASAIIDANRSSNALGDRQ